MKTLQEIEARLAEIASLVEERSDMPSDELVALNKEVDELKEMRKRIIEEGEQRSKLLANIASGKVAGTVTRTFPNPSAHSSGEARSVETADPYDTMEYRRAFMAHVTKGSAIPVELRADETTMTTDVGAVIPTTILNQIVEKMEAVGMILPLVTRTNFKGGLSVPVSSVKPTAAWVSEGSGSDKQKKKVISITFNYYKLRCKVAVTLEVDTVSLSMFESTLINNVVEAMTKALEQAIISGDGNGKPKGILSETPISGQTITAAALSYDVLIKTEAAVPLEYENESVWCMSKTTFMSFLGITDSTGQPIARINYGISGKPERTLLGREVVLNNYVDSFSTSLANDKTFAFIFRFKDYILNTNLAMGVKKYEDNETDDLVTRAVMLVDGKVVDKNSLVKLVKGAIS